MPTDESVRPLNPVPLDLFRLRAANTAYIACLRAALPTIVGMGELAGELRDNVDAALDASEMGTAARIAAELAVLLGEA
jgi:hypothetical protein